MKDGLRRLSVALVQGRGGSGGWGVSRCYWEGVEAVCCLALSTWAELRKTELLLEK